VRKPVNSREENSFLRSSLMAWTVVRDHTVFGNKAVVLLHLTADAATQNVDTGLKRVDHYNWSIGSANSGAGETIDINSLTVGTAAAGFLACSGFTAGDEVFVTVYGPA
jgi:hypothetical protein